MLSVVVPSRGDPARLHPLLAALAGQTLPRERFEIIVALDGAAPAPETDARLEALGARLVRLAQRSGPGAARNAGASAARGRFLVFTEDDVRPAPDWLERALLRLDADPTIDVLEGATLDATGRPLVVPGERGPAWLATNLFVRPGLFASVGGYHEAYFERERAVYYREDSDLGFTLGEARAHLARVPEVRVTHVGEPSRFLDPVRWARRYEMDALLAKRHPRLFRERIEVRRIGPLRVRRPAVRAAWVCVLAVAGALLAPLVGRREAAGPLLLLAAAAFLPIWATWRFSPLRLPAALAVPFVLVGSLVRGWLRTRTGVVR